MPIFNWFSERREQEAQKQTEKAERTREENKARRLKRGSQELNLPLIKGNLMDLYDQQFRTYHAPTLAGLGVIQAVEENTKAIQEQTKVLNAILFELQTKGKP